MNRIDTTGTGSASLGRNEDKFLAHVALGERVIPPVISQDLQNRLDQEMIDAGLDPNQYTVGRGMSINPITGMPEFFLKKAFKAVKKIARKAAPILQFVPGPIGAVAATVNRVQTIADVARGKASPLALASLGSGPKGFFGKMGKGSGLGSLFGNAKATPGINPIESGSSGLGGLFSRAKEFILPGEDKVGLFGNIGKGIGSLFGGAQQTAPVQPQGSVVYDESTGYYKDEVGNVFQADANGTFVQVGGTPASASGTNPFIKALGDAAGFGGRSAELEKYGYTHEQIQAMTDQQKAELIAKGRQAGARTMPGVVSNVFGGGSGFGSGLGGLASAGLGGFLGKLAYDAAKDRAGGLAVTPQVSMDALGRYQLASDLGTGGTRGEFGLAPKPAVLDIANMGQRQAFAVGGVAELDLREGGESIGPGTGTSDDIPAMLSDGEFVMTAKATRGAGAYDMKKNKSGIELVKSGSQSREKGVQNMRELMNIFESI